jgi:hypothetical protein
VIQLCERNGVKLVVDIESGAEADEMPDLWVLGTLWDVPGCDHYQLTCGEAPQDSMLVDLIIKTLSDAAIVNQAVISLRRHHRVCLGLLNTHRF